MLELEVDDVCVGSLGFVLHREGRGDGRQVLHLAHSWGSLLCEVVNGCERHHVILNEFIQHVILILTVTVLEY